jgi:N-acetylmuramoyl-L-alanine amidase
VADYSRLVSAYPRHRLADDAALSLARVHFERLEQPEAARRVLTEALAHHPRGDRARELRQLLASLPSKPPARKGPTPRAPEPAGAEPAPRERPGATAEAIARLAPEPPESVRVEAVGSSPEPRPDTTVVVTSVSMRRLESPPVVVVTPPKPPEPAPRPDTAPVDAHLAEARMKTAVKHSGRAELTLAEQLGLKVRRVVIDAGHGGHDTGAIGKKGTREKDVALAISQKLAAELRKRGLEVVLTRDDDRYLRLEDRARLANEARGDLFISVHCNSAANRRLRGVETYTLNTSANRYAIRLAARENASSEKGISDLQFILADLATKANTGDSSRLASHVQRSLVGQLSARYKGVRDLGNKEALFYVLLGAKMPAILVETSFLSHPEEEARLASGEYQDAVARAIARGVEDFLGDRSRLAKAD